MFAPTHYIEHTMSHFTWGQDLRVECWDVDDYNGDDWLGGGYFRSRFFENGEYWGNVILFKHGDYKGWLKLWVILPDSS